MTSYDFSFETYLQAQQSSAEEIQLWACPASTSPIETVDIFCNIPANIVAIMLQSAACLKSFRYFGDLLRFQEPAWLRDVGAALNQHRASLESIIFDKLKYIPLSNAGATVSLEPWQLNGAFPNLTRFNGPLYSLLEVDRSQCPNQLALLTTILPPTLEHLLLEIPPYWDPRYLIDLESSWNVLHFPKLTKLDIRCSCMTPAAPPFVLLALEKFFAKIDIACRFTIDFYRSGMSERIEEIADRIRAMGPAGVELAAHVDDGILDEEPWDDEW